MIQNTIHEAISLIIGHKLVKALALLKPIFDGHTKLRDAAEINEIDQTLNIMLHYMRQNADDPDRTKLYNNLLRRTFRVASDLEVSWRCKNVGFFITQFQKAAHLNMSQDFIRTVLETFVSDVAMLSLSADNEDGESKRAEIFDRHQTFIERLFAAITVSCQWSDGDRDFWSRLLISPTIDSNDAQTITSAIMLSSMNQFDANKVRTLASVYSAATDTALRERALIGFVFSIGDARTARFFGIDKLVEQLASAQGTARELLELQKQIFYCMNAERDKKKIEDEIMPDIAKNSPYRVNGNGMIEEREDDKMRDILHPDAEDKAMEQIEQSMEKITNMQRQGVDIYFGGFSHMKRFPFFSVAANWFTPYYIDQPEVSKVRQKIGNGRFIDLLLTRSSFCESDKYSFTFAVAAILDRMPQNLREMLTSTDVMNFEVPENEAHTATFIRRQYLQDLYRFFRLHPQRTDIVNPFDDNGRAYFFANDLFVEKITVRQLPSLAVFLHDMKRYTELAAALKLFSDKQKDTLTFWLLSGSLQIHVGDFATAVESFGNALKKDPENQMALRGMARAAMHASRFESADYAYGKLLELNPGHKSYLVNRGLAQLNEGKTDEASATIYEASYRYPDDENVGRVKAWLLMCQQKPEEAFAEYEKLTAGKAIPEDWLNKGYALWVTHRMGEAADAFKNYLKQKPEKFISDEFGKDEKLLSAYGLGSSDFNLMEELVDQ